MKLFEMKMPFNMDFGAPCPIILSNDTDLYLSFIIEDEKNNEMNAKTLIFNSYLKYNFGIPSNETLIYHPYSHLGIESYSFYELYNSDWLDSLMKIEQQHPYFNYEKWKNLKHFIITFHDNIFECIANDFKVLDSDYQIYNDMETMFTKF